ncbi:MAG: GNAT family N-acetyltransferase [Clostridiales bacterium]|nr:GNAT family N-acetyltransferase [Clostridiales bacterium]
MTLRLIPASQAPAYQQAITDMIGEWQQTGEKIIPYAIRRHDVHDFAAYCEALDLKNPPEGMVSDSTFFCLEEETGQMVGAVNIRHWLNDALLLNGGHIGDGVRPSRRREGIATRMIALALPECRKLGISKVLMVCDRENTGSRRSIENNGGVLENEVLVDGVWERRYWMAVGDGVDDKQVQRA